MANNVALFQNEQFGNIRTIYELGKVLFCGNDVAKALGYKRPNDAISTHCRGTAKRRITDSYGRSQEMLFIPEGDVYRLSARSKLPSAEKFESWIFDEILPSIRETGTYTLSSAPRLATPKDYPSALRALADEVERSQALLVENEQQKQVIADFEPKIRYLDTILASESSLATTQIAADYDLSAQKLNKILHAAGIQHNVNGQWILYSQHMGKGYTKSKTITIVRNNGKTDTVMHTQWTQKGRLLIHHILEENGIYAVMDRKRGI